jgi:hypothetical protein
MECMYCGQELGALRAGRPARGQRLAYDPGLGRLWQVCANCLRWNCVPLEDRWEALEACERATQGASALLLATAHLALVQVGSARFIRVGAPPPVELAEWRYSERLDRFLPQPRGWVARLLALPERPVGGYSAHGVPLFTPLSWVGSPFLDHGGLLTALLLAVPLAPVCPACGGPLALEPASFSDVRLALERDGPAVQAVCGLCGAEAQVPLSAARPTLRAGLAMVNRDQRAVRRVQRAAGAIERAGGGEAFVRELARAAPQLGSLPPHDRLSLWMSLEEAAEAEALEAEWKEAEGLAAIIDDELTPVPGFDEFRGRVLGRARRR